MKLRRLAPALVIVAVVLVQFAPVVRGRVYRFEDIAGYFEPLWSACRRAMLAGHWPLWDGGAWSGQPLLGDPQLGVFYPPNWLWLALPVLRAYAWMALVHALWAGLGMMMLVRARGGSRAAAALGGIALAVGGYLVLQVRHMMFVEATAWVPWMVWAGWRWLDDQRRVHLAAFGLATGALFLTGGVSMIYYALWFVAAVLLPRVVAVGRDRRERLLLVAALGFVGALGLCVAAPVLVPMGAHGPLSPRAQGTEYEFAASVAWRGIYFLPSLFIPNLLGQDVRGDYVGGGTQWEIAGYYAGVLPFALAVYTWVRGDRSRRGERIALGAICLFAVLLASGSHSPVHRLAYRFLPLYSSMRCPPRALYVFSFTVPLLGADGLDLALARLRASWRPALAALAVAVVAIDLLVTHRAENPAIDPATAHAQAVPAAARFLDSVVSDGARYVNDVHARHDLHNSGLVWNQENASGYSSLPIWRYLHFEWIANHGATYPHARLHDDLSAQGLWRLGSPLVDALAVRWLVTERPPKDAPHWEKRFAGPDGLDVWENPHALGRAWLVDHYRHVDGADAAARAIAEAGWNPRELAILEEEPAIAPATHVGLVHREAPSPTRLTYDVATQQATLLVMSEPYYPGWRATVDGQDAPLLAADYALRAVALPAGEHHVEVTFTSRPLVWGGRLAIAGLLLLLALSIRFPSRKRPNNRSS